MRSYQAKQSEAFRNVTSLRPSLVSVGGDWHRFHGSLTTLPNNDRLFPGRMDTQVPPFEGAENEWAVDCITRHFGSGSELFFEVKWKAGDITWMPLEKVEHLHVLLDYLEALDVDSVAELKGNMKDIDTLLLGSCGLFLEEGLDSVPYKQDRHKPNPILNFPFFPIQHPIPSPLPMSKPNYQTLYLFNLNVDPDTLSFDTVAGQFHWTDNNGLATAAGEEVVRGFFS